MADTFQTRDGQPVEDGETATFSLRYGDYTVENAELAEALIGDPVVVKLTGTVRAFDQVERVYDEEGIAIGKTSERRWEILTGDPQHPAVGFLPENVLTKTG